MRELRTAGIGISALGALLWLWGRDYVGSNPLEAIGMLFSKTPTTYNYALLASKYGPWILGIGIACIVLTFLGRQSDASATGPRGDRDSPVPDRSGSPEGRVEKPTGKLSLEAVAKRDTLKTRIEQDPLNPRLFESYGDLLAEISTPAEALLNYLRAIELEPANAGVHLKAARAYVSLGNPEGAEKHALRAIDHASQSQEVVVEGAAVLAKCGRGQLAEPALRTALESAPRSLPVLRAYRDLLALESSGRRNDELVQLCQRVVGLAPEDRDSWKLLGDTLGSLGRSAEAVDAYEKVLTLQPDDDTACLPVASVLHDQKKDYGRAEGLLRKALRSPRLDPRELNTARLLLASSILGQGNRESEAQSILTEVARFDLPTERHELAANCYSQLAAAFVSKGDMDGAHECFSAALRFADREDIRRAYADLLRRLGEGMAARRQFGSAIAAYDLALEQTPADESIRAARKRLASNRTRLRALVGAGATVCAAAGVGYFLFYPGTLHVTAQADAVLTLEGEAGRKETWKQVANTPSGTVAEAKARAGTYHLRVDGPHMVSWDSTVTIRVGRETRIVVPNLSGFGAWTVTSNVPASVSVDGASRGMTPLRIQGIPIGLHTIQVVAPGYVDISEPHTVQVDQDRPLHFQLRPTAETVAATEADTRQAQARRESMEREAQARADAANAMRATEAQERAAREAQQRQQSLAPLQRELPGKWFLNRPAANDRRNFPKDEGAYLVFESVSATGLVTGAYVQPAVGKEWRLQGAVDGMSITVDMVFEGVGRRWKGVIDLPSNTMSGDLRDINGSWVLRAGWSATKR